MVADKDKKEMEPLGTHINIDLKKRVMDYCVSTGRKFVWVLNKALEEFMESELKKK